MCVGGPEDQSSGQTTHLDSEATTQRVFDEGSPPQVAAPSAGEKDLSSAMSLLSLSDSSKPCPGASETRHVERKMDDWSPADVFANLEEDKR